MNVYKTPEPLQQLDHVCKSFGPIHVIKDVSIEVHAGKVQVLLGENGAGKSTLIKMMSGIYQPDSGRILIDGHETPLPDVRAAEAHGIATIHQELNLVPSLSVAENICLGRLPSRLGMLDRSTMQHQARKALNRIGLNVDLDAPVSSLGVAHQQLVEIAKALSQHARILILDEPTAALTTREIDQLFGVIEELRSEDVGMVFISHHLEEISRIGDSVSVLRDGTLVAEVPASTPDSALVSLMVGRDIDDQFPRRRPKQTGDVLLAVEGLRRDGVFEDISFEVHAGEVLGIAGLVGAGRTEVLRCVFGADRPNSGAVHMDGQRIPSGSVDAAIAAGMGLVPEDRKAQGLVLDAAVDDNIGLATLRSSASWGLADRNGQRSRAEDIASRLNVRMASIDQRIRHLSGGNQQKVVFGRWVLAGVRVLLLDEPTRGVDVGAKVEIYELINEVTDAGGAVVMVSSELPEVLGMSDRVLVMSDGRITGILRVDEASEAEVMKLAIQGTENILDPEDMPYPPTISASSKGATA